MDPSPHLDELTTWIEALLASDDGARRHRVLLDAAQALELGSACAVWRRVGPKGDPRGAWRPILERGPGDALPTAGQIEEALAGRLRWLLPHRAAIVMLEDEELGIALVLGELVEESESRLEALDALLLVWVSVERARAPFPSEWPEAPLPRQGEERAPEMEEDSEGASDA
jgi:hypothetical protein